MAGQPEPAHCYWVLVFGCWTQCPSGGNFGQNFQISDVPPTPSPPFALEKTVFSTLLDQNFQKFVHFPWRCGGAVAPPPHQDFRHWLNRPIFFINQGKRIDSDVDNVCIEFPINLILLTMSMIRWIKLLFTYSSNRPVQRFGATLIKYPNQATISLFLCAVILFSSKKMDTNFYWFTARKYIKASYNFLCKKSRVCSSFPHIKSLVFNFIKW